MDTEREKKLYEKYKQHTLERTEQDRTVQGSFTLCAKESQNDMPQQSGQSHNICFWLI